MFFLYTSQYITKKLEKSYNHDIIFLVKKIIKLNNKKEVAILKGIDVRVLRDAPVEDLNIVSKEEQKKREKELEQRIIYKIQNENIFAENRRKEVVYTGRILHLDGECIILEKMPINYMKIKKVLHCKKLT